MSTALVKGNNWKPPDVSQLGYKEVVLLNGAFAKIRPVKNVDYVSAADGAKGLNQILIGIALRVVKIDDVAVTLPQILEMDFITFSPIRRIIVEDLNRAHTQIGWGIA